MWLFSRPLFVITLLGLAGAWYVWGMGAVIITAAIAFAVLHYGDW